MLFLVTILLTAADTCFKNGTVVDGILCDISVANANTVGLGCGMGHGPGHSLKVMPSSRDALS